MADLAYIAAAALITLLAFNRKPVALWTGTPQGAAQLFYLVFLWWIVTGNFEKALARFAPERLVTEGIIYLNALVCTGLILLCPTMIQPPENRAGLKNLKGLLTTVVTALALTTVACWGTIRLLHGENQISYASKHIRFGPNATATKEKPSADRPHP